MLSGRKKHIRRLIIQGSRRIRDQNQRQISHRRMIVLILTLQCFLSITILDYYSKVSEWILDTGAINHVCPKREWFASFEKLDGGLVSFGNIHTCQIEEISTIHIKLFDGMIREIKVVRYVL